MRVLLCTVPVLFACIAAAGGAVANDRSPLASSGSVQSAPEVVMYVMPNCGYCEKARQLLTRHGVDWREVDVDSSSSAKKTFIALGGVGTPLITVGDRALHGYDEARINALLTDAGVIAR